MQLKVKTIAAGVAVFLACAGAYAAELKPDFDHGGGIVLELSAGATTQLNIIPTRETAGAPFVSHAAALVTMTETERFSFLRKLADSELNGKGSSAGLGLSECWAGPDMTIGATGSRAVCCLATMAGGVPMEKARLLCYEDIGRKNGPVSRDRDLISNAKCINKCISSWQKCKDNDNGATCLASYQCCTDACDDIVNPNCK